MKYVLYIFYLVMYVSFCGEKLDFCGQNSCLEDCMEFLFGISNLAADESFGFEWVFWWNWLENHVICSAYAVFMVACKFSW